ncbi:hypothetical protein CALVIDRAFT_597638 [Calocera viscosa TUFC12733]|uniref:Uncharacterized protein n=1 Tax=Calocera viscosa (strain TUFC12733) TaxID=1330018 RepID=A0A167N425_CALVF|nr:hypothetical protein CALVIDRAFT_597638 [Calocera viscosa TUFC12733]
MTLCSNRVPLAGSPSTCTIDTVLIPLPTWLLLAALPLVFILLRSRRSPPLIRTSLQKTIWVIYLVLLVADIAMSVLEMARLGVAKLGLGLLPFNTIGLIIVIVMVGCRGKVSWMLFPLGFFWLLLVAFEAVKVSRLSLLPSKTPTQYPGSDQVLDNAVMLALATIFSVLDTYEIIVLWRSRRRSHDALVIHPGLSDGSLPLRAPSVPSYEAPK